jgi:hypothetical protein
LFVIVVLSACTSRDNKPALTESKPDNSWLEEITIKELQQGYRDGKYTVTEVVSAYLERIQAIDENGPALNSIIMVNPDALEIAEELDREFVEGKTGGPLFGIPIVLKDNIDTHDKMPNTAGATVLRNSFPRATVRRKKAQGGRSSDNCKVKSERMGKFPWHLINKRLERCRRPDKKSIHPRPQSMRLKFRIRSCSFSKPLCGSYRYRNRWLNSLPFKQ